MGDLCDRGLDLRLSLVLMHFKRTSQQPRVACGPNVMPGPAAAGWGGRGCSTGSLLGIQTSLRDLFLRTGGGGSGGKKQNQTLLKKWDQNFSQPSALSPFMSLRKGTISFPEASRILQKCSSSSYAVSGRPTAPKPAFWPSAQPDSNSSCFHLDEALKTCMAPSTPSAAPAGPARGPEWATQPVTSPHSGLWEESVPAGMGAVPVPPERGEASRPSCSVPRVTRTFLPVDSCRLEGTADGAESLWSRQPQPQEEEEK